MYESPGNLRTGSQLVVKDRAICLTCVNANKSTTRTISSVNPSVAKPRAERAAQGSPCRASALAQGRKMFKHVLIPTDGSPRSKKAIKAGIAFAKNFGAKVTAYHALEVVPLYGDGGFVPPSVLEQFETGARKQAQKYLEEAT